MNLKQELELVSNDALREYIVEGCKHMAKQGKSSFINSWTYNANDERDNADCQKMYYNLKQIARDLENEDLVVNLEKDTYVKNTIRWTPFKETKIVFEVRW